MEKYEIVRNDLKQKKLINGTKTNICVLNGFYTECSFCGITQICATKVRHIENLTIKIVCSFVQDPFTGSVEETFKTPYTNPQHKIGGRDTVCIMNR